MLCCMYLSLLSPIGSIFQRVTNNFYNVRRWRCDFFDFDADRNWHGRITEIFDCDININNFSWRTNKKKIFDGERLNYPLSIKIPHTYIHGGWKKSRPLKWTRVSRIHLSKFDDTMSKYVVRNKGTMAARGGNGRENWANISRERARNKAYNNRRWRSNKQPSVGNTPVVCNAPKTAPRQEITMTMNEIRPASGQFHSSFISPSHLRHPGLTYTHVSGRVDR